MGRVLRPLGINEEHRHSGQQQRASDTSPRRNAIPAKIVACWLVGTNSISRHVGPIRSRRSVQTRNWTPVGAVTLNPDRDTAGRVACDAGELSSLSNVTYLASVKNPDLPGMRQGGTA